MNVHTVDMLIHAGTVRMDSGAPKYPDGSESLAYSDPSSGHDDSGDHIS